MGVLIKCFVWILFMITLCSSSPVKTSGKGISIAGGKSDVNSRGSEFLETMQPGMLGGARPYRHKRHNSDISRLLSHILEQVRRGHVSTAEMDHWKHEIDRALHSGDLSQEEYNQFVADLTAIIRGDGSSGSSAEESMLWFG